MASSTPYRNIQVLDEEYQLLSIIDWIDTVVQTGFEIHNPNEESACGCGVSVGF